MDIYVIAFTNAANQVIVEPHMSKENAERRADIMRKQELRVQGHLIHNIIRKYTLVGDTFVEDKEYTLKTGETDK